MLATLSWVQRATASSSSIIITTRYLATTLRTEHVNIQHGAPALHAAGPQALAGAQPGVVDADVHAAEAGLRRDPGEQRPDVLLAAEVAHAGVELSTIGSFHFSPLVTSHHLALGSLQRGGEAGQLVLPPGAAHHHQPGPHQVCSITGIYIFLALK